MKAMVLAAGYGTRLGELTKKIPKPMLDIAGRPLLEYTITLLAKHGFREIAINLHFLPDMIQNYFGDGERFGVKIRYSYEPELLVTAGALMNFVDFFREEEANLVIYGDILTDMDLSGLMQAHRRFKADATLTLHRRGSSNSIVSLNEHSRIVGFIERPSAGNLSQYDSFWVNSGIQVLGIDMINLIPGSCASDLPRDLYCKHLTDKRLYGFPFWGYRCAVDSVDRLQAVREVVASGHFQQCKLSQEKGL